MSLWYQTGGRMTEWANLAYGGFTLTDERDTTLKTDIPKPPPDLPDEVRDGDVADDEPEGEPA